MIKLVSHKFDFEYDIANVCFNLRSFHRVTLVTEFLIPPQRNSKNIRRILININKLML